MSSHLPPPDPKAQLSAKHGTQMPDSLLGPKRDKALDVVPVSQEMAVKNKSKQQRKSSVPKKQF